MVVPAEPELVKNLTVSMVRRQSEGGWPRGRGVLLDLTVSWAPPVAQPLRYHVTIRDNLILVGDAVRNLRANLTVPGVRLTRAGKFGPSV